MTNTQIDRLLLAAERIADALDRAIPKPIVLGRDEQAELDRLMAETEQFDTPHADEERAVIELLEMGGLKVPDESYKRRGITPPARRQLAEEPSADILEAPQPGTEPARPAEPLPPAEPQQPFEPEITTTRKPGL